MSTLNRRANSSEVWKAIGKIRGRPNQTIQILHVNGRCISMISEIVNQLATAFEQIAREENHSENFKRHKNSLEKQKIDFTSGNYEAYNVTLQFTNYKRLLRK